MSNNFESLLGELTARRKEYKKSEEKKVLPECHSLTVSFVAGKENEAKASGVHAPVRDAAALLYAAGDLLGEELDIDGAELGEAFINAAIWGISARELSMLLELL